MSKTLWIGGLALAAAAAWLVLAGDQWQPAEPGSGEVAGAQGRAPTSERAAERPGSGPGAAAADRTRASAPASGRPATGLPADERGDTVVPREGGRDRGLAQRDDLRSTPDAPNEEVSDPSSEPEAIARSAPGAGGPQAPGADASSGDAGAPALTGRGAPVDPVADAELIDYLARRSLGDNPTEAELNERRGWAETLLSAEGEEVRERVRDRAAAGE